MSYFNNHNHTEFSNLRLLDCICHPESLIDTAIEMGLSGIAITDHESLSAHVRANKHASKIKKQHPDFVVALGNEIYLTDTRDMNQKYFHFLIIAKDETGYKGLKELSSQAWINSYFDRGLERVPTLKTELQAIVSKYKGHILGTTSCIGGELGSSILQYRKFKNAHDEEQASECYSQTIDFLKFCIDVFGENDFYIECAPASYPDQIFVNKKALEFAKLFNIKMCVGTDSHYLTEKDRYVHKAYLNSKNGEREIDDFYKFTRLMTEQETTEFLSLSYDVDTIDWIYKNSNIMKDSISWFSLEKNQKVVEVEVTEYKKGFVSHEWQNIYPTLYNLIWSDDIQERYWVNECLISLDNLKEQNKLYKDFTYEDYLIRLEEEARVMKIIGEKLDTCIFAYPNTLKHYIDLFWNCGSTVGAGRGSACSGLNHYLLGVTQLDPLEWNFPYWRFLNEERIELPDIDLDLAPSKIQDIFTEIRKERGQLGLVQVCTFGTEGTRSSILTACRGYRSEKYPDGINVDEAQYMSSLIPSERGFLWDIKDVINGNPEKGRKPIKAFINAVEQYPGLIDIIVQIQGLVNKRSSHASGVILFDEDIFDTAAVMRTPSGALITQWDLHDQEFCGSTKYDFLLTSVQDIIMQTINLLQKDNIIESNLTLREVYNKYLHPSVLPRNDKKMWDALANNDVIGCFQFDSSVGIQAARKIKPQTPVEMSAANGLMRLMTQESGEEAPIDKYVRFKNNISLWYQELDDCGLTKEEQKTIEPYFLPDYGVPPSQELMMRILMDENICGFSLAEANEARKIVGKKLMNKIPALEEKVLNKAKSKNLGQYIWKHGIGPQMGYSFSIIHATAYSFIGMQTLYLATHFNPIYWNTAYLIVNSGAIDQEIGEQSDYTKIARAIGDIRGKNIQISLIDINHSTFGFKPDIRNNQILFGLKGLINMNNDLIKEIINNRPYQSLAHFYYKVKPNKQAMISLIKGGAFDQFISREEAMIQYLWITCDKKQRLTLQNIPGLIRYDLIPNTKSLTKAKQIFNFNKYLKKNCGRTQDSYKLDNICIDFLNKIEHSDLYDKDFLLPIKTWENTYSKEMDVFRDWIKEDKETLLDELNTRIFMQDWNKYAQGTVSAWEMEVLCFYYHEHELAHVNNKKYGFTDFFKLPEKPEAINLIKKGNSRIPIYKLTKICGTCIAKDKAKSMVYLLTTTGVVPVKFNREYFSLFDRQIFQYNEDGTKSVVEKSFFNRGQMVVVQGFRRENNFVAKNYKHLNSHRLYHIDKVLDNGELILRHKRSNGVL